MTLAVKAGVTYAIAMVCQTIGLERTTPSTAAFLTYLLVVAVPVLQFVFAGVRPSRPTVIAIAISVAGLVLLTGGSAGFGVGTMVTVVGAVLFGLHIIQMGDAAARYDVVRFNALQLGVVAVVLLPFVPFTGGVPTGGGSWVVILYAAIVVTVGTFLPWMWAQRYVPPTRAALILLTEPVFAALLSYATGERLSATALAGAAAHPRRRRPGRAARPAVRSPLAPQRGAGSSEHRLTVRSETEAKPRRSAVKTPGRFPLTAVTMPGGS